jgi:8-oxo-dGTP pyrophosphatase MutT (NUDIX family)
VSERRKAAVVMGIFASSPHGVVFIERAAHLRHHAGQIGFPGGAMDESDVDLQHAALREMEEEVGVTADRVTFVWTLPPVLPSVSNFDVTPFVAILAPGPLQIDATETAGVFTVPLATVLDEVRDGVMDLGTIEVETTLLDYDGKRIWGLTGRVLRTFVDAWNEPESAMRLAIEERLNP